MVELIAVCETCWEDVSGFDQKVSSLKLLRRPTRTDMWGAKYNFRPQTPSEMHHQEYRFVAFVYFHVAEDAEYGKARFHWPG